MTSSGLPDHGTVSVVVSTYNRPDALLAALSSVRTQSYPIHEIIVVGDCCDERTKEALDTLGDSRIRYINLDRRHGDQSGPNHRGVNESTGTWVAFLNHDDFWFPDHLTNAVSELSVTGKKWYCGVASFSAAVRGTGSAIKPVVTERGLLNRDLGTAFVSSVIYMEPASSWVVARGSLLKAGNWPFAASSVRTPVSFLALTLWRKLGEPAWGSAPSVLKVQGSLQQQHGGEYTSPSPVHRQIEHMIESQPRDWFKGFEEELTNQVVRDASFESMFTNIALLPLPRWLTTVAQTVFRVTGFDAIGYRLERSGIRRGHIMDQLLFMRTGEIRDSMKLVTAEQRGDR